MATATRITNRIRLAKQIKIATNRVKKLSKESAKKLNK
jgi:hypothetical protein